MADHQRGLKRHTTNTDETSKRHKPNEDDHSMEVTMEPEDQDNPFTYSRHTIPRKFIYHSRIFRLLHKLQPQAYQDPNNIYQLYQIHAAIKQLITERSLADPRNPLLIMCDPDLEYALNRRSIHVNQLEQIILMQMVIPAEYTNAFTSLPPDHRQSLSTKNPAPEPYISIYMTYDTTKSCYDFMRAGYPGTQQTAFRYYQILNKIMIHIEKHRHTMIDNRNPGIIHLKNDPLAKVLDADIIHISQMGQRISASLFATNPIEEIEMIQKMSGLYRTFYYARKANRLNL